jgi:ABC-2 type transport system permease protein
VDLFRDPIRWTEVVHGVIQQGCYVAAFLAAAWANFATKDVTD